MLIDDYRLGRRSDVWSQLRSLEEAVRDPDFFPDAQAVARETMSRVRHNVEQLHQRLIGAGYQFDKPEAAFVPATDLDRKLLDEVEAAAGPLPLAMRAFYECVGSVDFTQSGSQLVQWCNARPDTASALELLGEQDPLVVFPIAAIHHDVTLPVQDRRKALYAHRGWRRDARPDAWYCMFAPDEFHKANYSGGENYHFFIPDGGADFRIYDLLLGNSPNEDEDREWFVDHLRIALANGGFRGAYSDGEDEEPRKAPPPMAICRELAAGLLEI